MRKRRIALLGGLAGLTAIGGVVRMAPAQAYEGPQHTLQLSGTVSIQDYEQFSANEHCNGLPLEGSDWGTRSKTGVVIADRNNKCGGEIRTEVVVTGSLVDPEEFCDVNVTVYFYEGTSESTHDLDGTASKSIGCVSTRRTADIYVENRSEKEPDDHANVHVVLENLTP